MQGGGHNVPESLRLSWSIAAAAAAACVCWLIFAPTPAHAVDQHLFDPVLSLEGNCSGADGAVDPGCVGEPPEYPSGQGNGPKEFDSPCGAASDRHGDIYVATPAEVGAGRIDVFDAKGDFLVEISNEHKPCGTAVDSKGNIYVSEYEGTSVVAYEPKSYPPEKGTEYIGPVSVYKDPEAGKPHSNVCLEAKSVAIDPSNDHLYIGHGCWVEEYGLATEKWPLIKKERVGPQSPYGLTGIDVYGKNHDIYAAGISPGPDEVFVLDGVDGHRKCEISGIPKEGGIQLFEFGLGAPIAVDQTNGDLYIWDTGHSAVDQFAVEGEQCKFVGTLPKPSPKEHLPWGDIAVDDPIEQGETGYDSPNEGYVYITSGATPKASHLYAFKPKKDGPPEVRAQGVVGVSETEAVLRAELNPNAFDTHYHFEYLTEAEYLANGESFVGPETPTVVPESDGNAGEGGAFIAVSEPITGLAPGTGYHLRLVARNNCKAKGAGEECVTSGEGKPGEEGEDASFSTYATPPVPSACLNSVLRTGASAALPDCRAYELVTPPDTNGHIPTMAMLGEGFGEIGFDTTMASPDGNSLIFGSDSGSLPGIGGGGFYDTFEALRNAGEGWQSNFTGPSGAQAEAPRPGGISANHAYSFWSIENSGGTLAYPATEQASYLRVPVGTTPRSNCLPAAEPESRFEWIGCGDLGFDPQTQGLWISEGGDHVIFETGNGGSTPVQLEPCAPSAAGVRAIYDRTPGGETRCISVPPAGSSAETEATFSANSPSYGTTSADGSTVAFSVGGILYVRVDNSRTVAVAGGGPIFGGLSQDGSRVFYLEGGNAFACDIETTGCTGEGANEPVQIGSGGKTTLVNVSADGSHVYFISPAVLTGEEENGQGAEAKPNEENLYAWDGSTVSFVAQVNPLDVTGEGTFGGLGGLGRWVPDAFNIVSNTVGPADDPSRSTPNGKTLVFESSANLTGYDSGKHREVYRFQADAPLAERLACLSCNPTGVAARSGAQLESPPPGSPGSLFPPVGLLTHIANVSADGEMVFFQSADRLVSEDVDGKVDVYEWEAEGRGGCERQAGCLSLISTGHSTDDAYLYAMTPDAHDVFFMSGDTLVAQDPDKTPSIYDARVNGGFPPPPSLGGECLGEACQPTVAAPDDQTPASSSFEGPGNPGPKAARRCGKGEHRIRRAGKTRCVSKHSKGQRQTSKHRHGKQRMGQ